MQKILKYLFLICLIFLIQFNLVFAEQNKDTLVQISTIDALMNGLYDGFISVSEALKYGDTGIGTFDGLDGEMITFN
ncbi:MAG: acetolactate decarboxylase [Candidatus Firestonebacteria bacterium]|nr:acetolactate decarboxylase [Candidatus Firestonebacteria bacterium]